jgi:hypothetical protein
MRGNPAGRMGGERRWSRMTYRGRVKNGTVVLEAGASLPEGSEVLILPVPATDAAAVAQAPDGNSVWQQLLELAGTATGLPPDLPERHDHYRRRRVEP